MGQEAGVEFDDKGLGPIVGWPRAVFSCWQRGLGLAAGKGTLNIGPKNTTNVGPKIKLNVGPKNKINVGPKNRPNVRPKNWPNVG